MVPGQPPPLGIPPASGRTQVALQRDEPDTVFVSVIVITVLAPRACALAVAFAVWFFALAIPAPAMTRIAANPTVFMNRTSSSVLSLGER
jgi:hypothetical protein